MRERAVFDFIHLSSHCTLTLNLITDQTTRPSSRRHMRPQHQALLRCSLRPLVRSPPKQTTSDANNPQGSYYPSNAPPQHTQNLPALPGLTGPPTQASPHQPAQPPPSSEPGAAAQSVQGPPQGPPYSLPGISQTLQPPHNPASTQANLDRERETRERELMETHAAQHAAQQEEMAKREAEQRERELRERQQHEQVTHENHTAPMQIHQPVAVAPSTRTVHGPNGLLGQSGPLGGPAMTGAANPPNSMFGGASVQPVQQAETTPRMQHAVQPAPQPSMLVTVPGPTGPLTIGQGQQPILNVCPRS